MRLNFLLIVCILSLSVAYSAIEVQEYIRFRPSQTHKLKDLRIIFARVLKFPPLKSSGNNNIAPITREKFIDLAKQKIKDYKSAEVKKYAPYVPSRKKYVTTTNPNVPYVSTSTIGIDDRENTEPLYVTSEDPFTDYSLVTLPEDSTPEQVGELLENSLNNLVHSSTKDPDSVTITTQVTKNYKTTLGFEELGLHTTSDSYDLTTMTSATTETFTGKEPTTQSAGINIEVTEKPTTNFEEEFRQTTIESSDAITTPGADIATTDDATEKYTSEELTKEYMGSTDSTITSYSSALTEQYPEQFQTQLSTDDDTNASSLIEETTVYDFQQTTNAQSYSKTDSVVTTNSSTTDYESNSSPYPSVTEYIETKKTIIPFSEEDIVTNTIQSPYYYGNKHNENTTKNNGAVKIPSHFFQNAVDDATSDISNNTPTLDSFLSQTQKGSAYETTEISLTEDHTTCYGETTIPTDSIEAAAVNEPTSSSALSKTWNHDSTRASESEYQTAEEYSSRYIETTIPTESVEATAENEPTPSNHVSRISWSYDSTMESENDYETTDIYLTEDYLRRYMETTVPTESTKAAAENELTPSNPVSQISWRHDSTRASESEYQTAEDYTSRYIETTIPTESVEATDENETTPLNPVSQISWSHVSTTESKNYHQATNIYSTEDFTSRYIETTTPTDSIEATENEPTSSNPVSQIFWSHDSTTESQSGYQTTDIYSTKDNTSRFVELMQSESDYLTTDIDSTETTQPTEVIETGDQTTSILSAITKTPETGTEFISTPKSSDATGSGKNIIEGEFDYLSSEFLKPDIDEKSAKNFLVVKPSKGATEIAIEENQSFDIQGGESYTICCSTAYDVTSDSTALKSYMRETLVTTDMASTTDILFIPSTADNSTTDNFTPDTATIYREWNTNETREAREFSKTNPRSAITSSKDRAESGKSTSSEDILLKPVKFTYDTDVMPTLDEF